MNKDKPSGRAKTHKTPGRAQRTGSSAKTRWIWIGLGVAAIASVLFLLSRPGDRGLTEVTAAEAYDEYQGGAFILDVRQREEWSAAHIPGSVVIPLDELAGRLDELPEEGDIIVVCVSGVRSAEGAKLLVAAGFSPVSSVRGGLGAWDAAGYPLEQASP